MINPRHYEPCHEKDKHFFLKKKEQRDWLIVTNPRLKSHCHKNWIWRHFKNHIFFTEIEK